MAILVGVCALVVSVFQMQSERKQQYASVWPSLSIMTRTQLEDDSTKNEMMLMVSNKGVGPAIVENVELWYKNHPCKDESELSEKITGEHWQRAGAISQIWQGRVIASNEEFDWIKVSGYELTGKFQTALKAGDIRATIRFASVYGERWEVNFNQGKRLVVKLGD